ncbi:ALBINO3-like protein 2, chloroplastic [Macadamia integrifolia]|uniref:ALBINO3-like protein 2, chloroplastic n=1 Tax=Macadamia integrifolia TaxID=60698 RepID=UPI001C4E2F97|nr:ALBINO3-like protein 2, chloroplastic [Macadamia integrifolia]
MGIPKLCIELRRFRSLSSSFSLSNLLYLQNPNYLLSSPSYIGNRYSIFRDTTNSSANSSPPYWDHTSFRSFSSNPLTSSSGNESGTDGDLGNELKSLTLDFSGSGVADGVVDVDGLFPPVRVVISLLDGYHELTGLPWWVIIASSTLALRLAILPLLIVQLTKLKKISELFPKLPPPVPPPFSGKSYIEQYLRFRKEKQALGCPSFLWSFASFAIQVPCFLLWMTSIRRMSLDHYPGFDTGGTLWFQNLTEQPHGLLGPIFPVLIAGLHFINVQISFQTSTMGQLPGLFSILAKYYKLYLDVLTLPLLVIGFYIPQGSLIYWVTNSSLTIIQQLSLKHPAIRTKLGLPDKNVPAKSEISGKFDTPEGSSLVSMGKKKISVQRLSPDELLALSVQILAKGQKDKAIPLLRLALEKDPEYMRALVVLGQTLFQKGMLTEAIEHLERAISKLSLVSHPTNEQVDLLILASQWAGVSYISQERTTEGREHLERIVQFKEPEDPKGKAHYFDGLLLLASALYREGRNIEAEKYLRMAVAYNPANSVYLEEWERDEDYPINLQQKDH